MSDEQRQKIYDLSHFCKFGVGAYDKRFVRDMSTRPNDYELTEKQAAFLDKTHHRYREQIHDAQERGWQTWFTRYGGEDVGYERLNVKRDEL